MEHFLKQGLISESKVLDIRQVDVRVLFLIYSLADEMRQIADAKILENDVPVFLISFATQEVMIFRNAKTKEVAVGAEDKVEQCTYVAAITRIPEELDDELTGGWKVVEVRTTFFF